ncbi:hypothetical protein NDA11_006582 [Ustilago hordei]|nr:hypothetical protein NDA10_004699 [Ustilago hordei]KAJ1583752.1 hypothetical protein NDA15_006443 [Ustilago hordei]KAJ1586836.1 hypothetical protein NDA11_006582 [Ustilago hordei]KAJ1592298.1 hypothetical protein NDA12_007448 [Ustilago hordei]
MMLPASSSSGSGLADTMLSASSPNGSGLADTLLPASSLSGSGLADVLWPASSSLGSSLTGPAPPVHPNTTCKLPIFNHSDTPTTVGFLKLEHWAPFLDLYPDQDFANQLRGALRHGACQGSRA